MNKPRIVWWSIVILVGLCLSAPVQAHSTPVYQILPGIYLKVIHEALVEYCHSHNEISTYPTEDLQSIVSPGRSYSDGRFRYHVWEYCKFPRFILGPIFAIAAFLVVFSERLKKKKKLILFFVFLVPALLTFFSFQICELCSSDSFPVVSRPGYAYLDEYVFFTGIPIEGRDDLILAYERFDLRPDYENKLVLYANGEVDHKTQDEILDQLGRQSKSRGKGQ